MENFNFHMENINQFYCFLLFNTSNTKKLQRLVRQAFTILFTYIKRHDIRVTTNDLTHERTVVENGKCQKEKYRFSE